MIKIPALNWAKIGLVAVLALALFGGGFLIGGNKERVECEKDKAVAMATLMEAQQKQIAAYNKELKERIIVANRASKEAAELASQLEQLSRGANDEIAKRNPGISCAPSAREHQLYKDAARKTRHP